jgi:dTDP-glucose pyrophosphorylase
MNVVVTMAGLGQRFRDAGYDVPKYRITAHGRTLFAWSMSSLHEFWRAGAKGIFVVRRADDARAFIEDEAARLGIAALDLVELDAPTDGQATTALLAGAAVRDPDEPMAIYNIDTMVRASLLSPARVRGDGWIPCFPGEGEGWSFARAGDDLRVVEVREKRRISPWATVGLYAFSSFRLYADLYRTFFARGNGLEKGERYVAPMYNGLVQDGRPVFLEPLPADALVPLGTPAELASFLSGPAPAWAPVGPARGVASEEGA